MDSDQQIDNIIDILSLDFNDININQQQSFTGQQIQNNEQQLSFLLQQVQIDKIQTDTTKPKPDSSNEKEILEEPCPYCKTLIIKNFLNDHLEECIEYIEFQFQKIEVTQFSVECCVCCLDIEPHHELRVLKCSHQYHNSCINEWSQRKNECPLCRSTI